MTPQFRLFLKLAVVFGVVILLTIPILMLGNLASERKDMRDQVVREIARESIDAQRLAGPVLVVPFKRRWTETIWEQKEKDAPLTARAVERNAEGRLHFLPEALAITADLVPEKRHRGIYEALTFTAAIGVSGRFRLPRDFAVPHAIAEYEFGPAELTLGIGDNRGIAGLPVLEWGGSRIEFLPGSSAPPIANGMTARLGTIAIPGEGDAAIAFRTSFSLAGLGQIDFVPTGKESVVTLAAAWPHPKFYGRFLPRQEIGEESFRADWRTSFLATNLEQRYAACFAGNGCGKVEELAHGVELIDPVDIYLQTERAIKYAFLFIGLTFAAFFVFEVLAGAAIHPVQYGLVGISLALFFLLVLSIAEVASFAVAYAAATLASVALIGFYLAHVLGNRRRALGFAAGLGALYGALYVILSLESVALLAGSAILFGALAATMVATRRVDWYALGRSVAADGAKP